MMPNSDPEGQTFLSAPSNQTDSFSCIPLSPVFNFNIEVAINESHSYTLTSAILKINIIWAASSEFVSSSIPS